jgi:hypothetical protein
MTAVKGSKFTTASGKKVTKAESSNPKAVKVKVKKGTATLSMKSSASVSFEMEDGSKYTVKFTVEALKAVKSAKKMGISDKSVTLTLKDMFGTSLNGGTLSMVKGNAKGQAKLDEKGKTLTVNPKEPDSISVMLQYLNKKYKLKISIK